MAKKHKAQPKEGEIFPELPVEVSISYPESVGGNDHYYDPYTPMAGPIANGSSQPDKKKNKKGSTSSGTSDEQAALTRTRKVRYENFIEHMVSTGGNMVLALSLTYGIPSEELKPNLRAYRDDVALGAPSSSVSALLEDVGLGKRARVAILAKYAYSDDPKVALVATKLATDLDGDKHDHATTYETYLRMVKAQK